MKTIFGITLVLIVALLASSPPIMANLANSEDQDNRPASVAIMNDAISQNADMTVQANTVQSIDAMTANMTTTNSQEAALVAPDLVAAGSLDNLGGYMISAKRAETIGIKEMGAFRARHSTGASPRYPV